MRNRTAYDATAMKQIIWPAVAVAVTITASGAAAASTAATGKSAADKKIAHRAVLRSSDFPPGWKAVAGGGLGTGCALKGLAPAASGQSNSLFTKRPSLVASSVYVYRKSATATHWFVTLTSPATQSCLKAQIATVASPGKLSVGALRIAPVGAQRAGIRFGFKVHGMGRTFTEDLEFVRAGRGLVFLELFTAARSSLSSSLEAQLTKILTGRLADGLRAAR